MNTDRENWIEDHIDEHEFFKGIEWIEKKHPKVYQQFVKDLEEHTWGCKHDQYYSHCYGGGKVPVPCCQYCTEYDGDRCHIRWNNNDEIYYNPDLDDKDPDELCDSYEWNGEWEED